MNRKLRMNQRRGAGQMAWLLLVFLVSAAADLAESIAGIEANAIPKIDSDIAIVDEMRFTEEQRRLMYVAITRTKKILMRSSVLSVLKAPALSMKIPTGGGNGVDVATQISRLLGELGPSAPAPIMGNMQ